MRRFTISYLNQVSFKVKIWITSHHVTEYTFDDNGQNLIHRRESFRWGGPVKKITTEKQFWKAFKSEIKKLSIDEQLELPAKILRLYLWKYPCEERSSKLNG